MSRISRLVVIVTALASLFAVMSATAGAVTWTNDGATAFTATGGQGTLTSGTVTTVCTGSDASGTAPASVSGTTYSVSGTILFTGCTAAGNPSTIECGYTLTATTLAGANATGNADFTCGVYFSGTKLCHIEGQSHAFYTNPTAGVGRLTVTTTSGLAVTGASCPVAGSAHLTPLNFATTSANPPTITRAA
jgi:opacity protein-like surface antigen